MTNSFRCVIYGEATITSYAPAIEKRTRLSRSIDRGETTSFQSPAPEGVVHHHLRDDRSQWANRCVTRPHKRRIRLSRRACVNDRQREGKLEYFISNYKLYDAKKGAIVGLSETQ